MIAYLDSNIWNFTTIIFADVWDILTAPWQICLELGWESFCKGSIPIGSIVVDSRGKVISKGRNRKFGPVEQINNQIVGGPLAHAEINALLALDWESVDVYTCELYTTVEPCPLCIGAICMSGLKKVRYASRDAWAGSVNLLDATPYFCMKRIEAVPPQDVELETIIHMLQVVHLITKNHPRTGEILEKWKRVYPENVRKGRLLFESGELQRMRARDETTATVVDWLYDFTRDMDG